MPEDAAVGSDALAEVERLALGRRSIRRFRPDPVPECVVRRILEVAGRAPSGANMQPWRVHAVTGPARQRVVEAALAAIRAGGDTPEYRYYPEEWFEPYRGRRRKVGFDLYGLLGIHRDDMPARQQQFERNFMFFDAPVGLLVTVDRRLATGSWIDAGIFIGHVMLLARAHGLESCPQAAWHRVHATVRRALGIPEEEVLLCGIALGHPDPGAPENTLETERAPLDDWATFHDD